MLATSRSDAGPRTLQQMPLVAGAVDSAQEHIARTFTEVGAPGSSRCVRIAQLPTNNPRVSQVPTLVAYRSPYVVDENLHPTFVRLVTIN